jgi:hypothetical protein
LMEKMECAPKISIQKELVWQWSSWAKFHLHIELNLNPLLLHSMVKVKPLYY